MEFNSLTYLICIVSFIVITFYLIPLAKSLRLVDLPSGRKKHQGEVPTLGGISIFISFSIGLFFININLSEYQNIFLTLFLILMIGVFDDIWDLSAKLKLLFHILAISFSINHYNICFIEITSDVFNW